ncbi:MAG: ferritin [Gemmatimonadota bacterium]
MNENVQKALNDQIGLELESAYAYLSMSAQLSCQNFEGFATWMRMQAQEELGHAMRLFDYMLERGCSVQLPAVPAPTVGGSHLELFETALAHEQKVTASIHELYDLARAERDYATELQLQWFVTEQVEEEASVGLAVEKLRRAGDDQPALLMLDTEFGARQPE